MVYLPISLGRIRDGRFLSPDTRGKSIAHETPSAVAHGQVHGSYIPGRIVHLRRGQVDLRGGQVKCYGPLALWQLVKLKNPWRIY